MPATAPSRQLVSVVVENGNRPALRIHRPPTRRTGGAGLTPRHRESDTTVDRGRITRQGSTLLRWAAVEAGHCATNAGWLAATRTRIGQRRGRNVATVAVARKLLTLVYYGLRDGHIRALRPAAAAG
jgi:transposase